MPLDETLVIVVSGGRRYALARAQVRTLRRDGAADAPSLAALIGAQGGPAERYTVSPVALPDVLLRVAQADLREALPRLELPPWLASLAHPAVVGLVLDGAELLPLVDLGQLAVTTGYVPL